MQKKLTRFFLYFTVTSTCFSMHQLTRPAVTQASVAIASITPQLNIGLRNCTTSTLIRSNHSLTLFKNLILEEQKEQIKLLNKLNDKIDELDNKLDTLNSKLNELDDKLGDLDDKINDTNDIITHS